ncbi:MAG TPA: nucleotide disphospho-sugar-binding domain-containing protein [Actinomycetota bacterium]|nr:nucleotide disphospho-sugar-binding domain-containing protein [Actinomycetota bacterium]
MARVVVVATAGAGGDLPPLAGAAVALRDRGHEVLFVGDGTVERSLRPIGLSGQVLPPEVDLGPRLIAAVRDAMATTSGDLAAAGPVVRERMTGWAREAATPVSDAVREMQSDVVLTSLFGVEVLEIASPACPWVVVNSTFYVGPSPPRPMEDDWGPRAIPLLAHYATLLEAADLVLHASDRVFDLGFDGLPPRHHYVGPLGIWEPPSNPPAYLAEPGDPWVLVTISSQLEDDLPLAEAALGSLAEEPVRVLLTVGPDHDPDEVTATGNARIERSVSHAAVLEHGRLLVSHAGHGSVMKALWFGRPMVLVPWGRDQPGVAARAAALGVAEIVSPDEAAAGGIAAAVRRTLSDRSMLAAAARHRDRLRATDPPGTAAGLVEGLL